MQMERRALYNLLRMNWLRDPKIPVEPWQVEEYRAMPLDLIFDKIRQQDVLLDRVSFLALAEEFDTPEDLTDHLVADIDADAPKQDQIYLLVFELWRRLIPEKLCLSIFCDELDHQIDLHDKEQAENPEPLQDALANLAIILDENTDQGGNPQEVFKTISSGCANDIEEFLYDFITDQIENKNLSYAAELLEDFTPYVADPKWFELLKARAIIASDIARANFLIAQLVENTSTESDLEFNLETLSTLVQGGDRELFLAVVAQSIPLLKNEEEFQDLLTICADYLHFLDQDHEENAIYKILKERSNISVDRSIDPSTPHFSQLIQILRS